MPNKEKTYQSPSLAALHEFAADLHEVGLLDKQTMRRFDKSCLTPIEAISGDDVRKLRDREGISQTVFATYLNVTVSTISQWERGEKRPSGAALKLLSLVKRKGLQSIL